MVKMSRVHASAPNATFLPAAAAAAVAAHEVLKSLLDNPVKLPARHHDAATLAKGPDKEKKLDEECSAPQSAFLGPTLWDKTLPYDGNNFQLEYMDLEEFLSENGIPAQLHVPPAPPLPPPPSVMDLSGHASTSIRNVSPACLLRNRPGRVGKTFPLSPPAGRSLSLHRLHKKKSAGGLSNFRNTPSPIDPDSIQVPVGYDPDPADLALSSVPGQEMFDPRKRKFSAEELKPQPMIKKARKVFIPEDLKDEKYWARRRKNNMAAKRSRDARRLKENQIAIRAGFLEKENLALRQEVGELRKELGRTKNILAKYEAQHGHL
ncbi:hepatic leukemia factor isoform X2 [Syngnathus scovelli]|uniref:hepatic leukemia factor isoform X2 n=1 Tax=Syngnathus scovelli TaxID=161590 RepID=UPI00210F9899|nr:hepatic leukemia factor isoform X2 [Syngnathus scovelli]